MAVVAVAWQGDRLRLAGHRIWQPSPDEPLDIEATIEAYLLTLEEKFLLQLILCDPYQLHRTMTTLKAKGLPVTARKQDPLSSQTRVVFSAQSLQI